MAQSPLTKLIKYPYESALLFACLAYLLLTIKFFIDADVSYPVFDNWGYFADLIEHADSNRLTSFVVKQANEHRPTLTFLSMVVDYKYFGFDLTFIKIFHLLSYGALVGFFFWLSGQIANDLDHSIKKTAKVLFSVSSLFFMLSMRQWEIHYGYTNVGTIQGFLFFICSIYLYNRRFDRLDSEKHVTNASLAAVVAFALLSSASMVFGLLTIPFLFVISVLRGADKNESWLLVVLACTIFFIYGIGLNPAPSSKTEWQIFPEDLIRILYFSVMLLGSLFIAKKQIAVIIGITGMVITLMVGIVFFIKKQHNRSVVMTVYCFLLFAFAYAVLVGIGRRHMIDEQAMVSRYMLAAAIYWQSLFSLSIYAGLQFFPHQKSKILTLFKLVIIPLIIVLFVHQQLNHKLIKDKVKNNSVAVNALRFGIFDPDTFPMYQVINMDELYSWIKVLKDHKTSIYGTKPAIQYGQKIHEIYGNNSRCDGDISTVTNPPVIRNLVSDSSTLGLKLYGSARNKLAGLLSPSRILLVDQYGVIKGAGTFSDERPNVPESLSSQTTEGSGWVAFARLDQDATAIYGYAIYDDENEACLFDTLTIPKSSIQ